MHDDGWRSVDADLPPAVLVVKRKTNCENSLYYRRKNNKNGINNVYLSLLSFAGRDWLECLPAAELEERARGDPVWSMGGGSEAPAVSGTTDEVTTGVIAFLVAERLGVSDEPLPLKSFFVEERPPVETESLDPVIEFDEPDSDNEESSELSFF